MPIQVVCPACKAEFKVSDKFAGRSGPCPKCKAVIKVPTAAEVEVTVHAPEEAQVSGAPGKSGKTTTGRLSVKPIARQETQLKTLAITGIVVLIASALAGAWFGRAIWQQGDPPWLRGLALLLVSIPIVLAGYTFLRDEELEPWRGRSLWLRVLICAVTYTGLWVAFYFFVPVDLLRSTVTWFFLAPPVLLVGAGLAYATFDLDFGNAFFHYCFYLVTTLGLGYLAGLKMPWVGTTL